MFYEKYKKAKKQNSCFIKKCKKGKMHNYKINFIEEGSGGPWVPRLGSPSVN